MELKLTFASTKFSTALITMLALTVFSIPLTAQKGIYYDVMLLTKSLQTPPGPGALPTVTGADMKPIIHHYFKNPAADLAANPFMNGYIDVAGGLLGGGAPAGPYVSKSFVSGLGGMDVTNIADGLAKFLVKRMKEELTITFFDDFNKALTKQEDLKRLFPSTYSTLLVAGTEIYNYQKYLPALQAAFEFDLNQLLANSYAWSISTPNANTTPLLNELLKDPALTNVVRIVLYVARELNNGKHPGDVLASLIAQPEIVFSAINVNLKPALDVTNLFSQSLRSSTSSRYWITNAELQALLTEDHAFRIYMALIYQMASDTDVFVVGGTNHPFQTGILRDVANDFNQVAKIQSKAYELVNALYKDIEEIEALLAKIKADEGKKITNYVSLMTTTASMAQTIISNSLFQDPLNPVVWNEVKFYSDHSALLFADIQSRAYSSGVFEAYTILDHAMGANPNKSKVLGPFLKYGTFMATVATAQTSDDVATAIENAALPPGSARIKREMAWNISLNAYLGGFYGQEQTMINGSKDVTNVSGVFAPVGLAVSRNFRIAQKANFSLSLFGSIIDIGALASYRLNSDNNSVQNVPQIKLENIISPGGFLVLGLPRIPVSVGYGYQTTPQLRGVTSQAVTLENQTQRWSGFIAVDIPLANFWSRARKN